MLLKNIPIAHLNEHIDSKGDISLEPLVAHLNKFAETKGRRKHLFSQFGLDKILEISRNQDDISETNLQHYLDIFEMIHSLQQGLHFEDKGIWALGYPVPNEAFYGTTEFYDFVSIPAELVSTEDKANLTPLQQLLYIVILERFYGMPHSANNLVYKVIKDGIENYYGLDVDFSFVNITRKGELPAIDFATLRDKDVYSAEDLKPLMHLLDPNNFTFSGFTIVKFEDKTIAYVSDLLHKLINDLSQYQYERFFDELQHILATISGSAEIYASLLPVLELNGYPVLPSDFSNNSILAQELKKRNDSGEIDPEMANYFAKPYSILYGIEKSLDTEDALFRKLIQKNGLASYISIPLKQRDSLVGFLEIYSYQSDKLAKKNMIPWKTFIPLLTQLVGEIIVVFKSSLERIILNNFTALNPAVEWRFNEVAANQIVNYACEGEIRPLEKVRFEKVYPIYGAVDVKGSTQLRNSIYREDNLSKIAHLESLLHQLPKDDTSTLIARLRKSTSEVKGWMESKAYEKYMLDVFLFLNEELFDILENIKVERPTDLTLIDTFKSEQKNIGGERSDIFETSLQELNGVIKEEVQLFNAIVQDIFPSYFELFRSDGVEYDMYVGQSITPTKIFEPRLLREIRKQQLISMARIGRRASQIKKSLAVSMEVTLLVFVHTSAIDISFREDERRFDVEGGYNIRYQMVKKRIDKVRIKDSKERLVCPNTIAIVFQGESFEMEIRSLLTELIEINVVQPDFDVYTLEEIQGVSELRAVRAAIVLDEV